jgi:amino acid transporter
LREVRWGETSRGAYLRVVPARQRFKRTATGHITATMAGSRPPGRFERTLQTVKSVVLGSPFSAAQAVHERLTKVKALAVFSSDALSSSAYATEEILLVLVLAGSGSLHNALPIALVIIGLLALVTISYRQTIKAYPNGGGAYIVAHENLGVMPGLVAAGALLVDYVLTVAVSVAAGVAAITSAAPDVLDYRVIIGVLIIVLIMLANLRGVRESGSIFAAPTYMFIGIMTAAIAVGFIKIAAGSAPGSILHEAPPREDVAATQTLGLFLILKAFSSGCAALTGVEAISNGVPAFKPPEARNARTTLTAMAIILGFLFLGITFVSSRFGFVASEHETVVSQLGKEVFGKNFIYYFYQAATAAILCLAANTSYADFPRLSAILAKDKFMPRQFSFRGDRLAFSNGILLLSIAAVILIVAFNGEVSNLIPLYAVGVFVSFTLSQGGMVIHWLRLREPGWRTSLVINFVGMAGTAIVATIIAGTKFIDGAWISIAVMLLLVAMFWLIHRHYRWYEEIIRLDESDLAGRAPTASPLDGSARQRLAVIPVDDINRITISAVDFARAITPNITAVHLVEDAEHAEEFRHRWSQLIPDVPLLVIESPYRAFAAPMLAYIESVAADKKLTVILPAFQAHHWYESLLHNQAIRRLRPFLDDYANVDVVEFNYDVRAPSVPLPPHRSSA